MIESGLLGCVNRMKDIKKELGLSDDEKQQGAEKGEVARITLDRGPNGDNVAESTGGKDSKEREVKGEINLPPVSVAPEEGVGEGVNSGKDDEEEKTTKSSVAKIFGNVEKEQPIFSMNEAIEAGLEVMDDFMSMAQEEIDEIKLYIDAVGTKYSTVLDYFGEEKDMLSQDFFTTLNKFLKEFVTTREKVERLAKLEEVRGINGNSVGSPEARKANRRATVAIGSDIKFATSLASSDYPASDVPTTLATATAALASNEISAQEGLLTKVGQDQEEVMDQERERLRLIEQGRQRFEQRQRELAMEREANMTAAGDSEALAKEQERQRLAEEGRLRFEQMRQKKIAESACSTDAADTASIHNDSSITESNQSISSITTTTDGADSLEERRRALAEEGRRRFEQRQREKTGATAATLALTTPKSETTIDANAAESDEIEVTPDKDDNKCQVTDEVDEFLDRMLAPDLNLNFQVEDSSRAVRTKGRRASVI